MCSAKSERPPGPALTESDKALGNGGWESTFLFGSVQREDAGAGGRGTQRAREGETAQDSKRENLVTAILPVPSTFIKTRGHHLLPTLFSESLSLY